MTDAPPDGVGPDTSGLPTRFGWSALSNYALTAVLMVVALVTTPVLTSHLGAERYGIWILVGSSIAYVQLLELGFGGAVVSSMARLSAVGDDEMLERILNSSFFLLVALGVVALGIAALAAVVLPGVVHLSPSLQTTTRELLLLLGFDMAVSIPMDTFGCGLVALQRYDLLNSTLIAVAVAEAVAWTLVLVNGGGLLLLGVVTVAVSFVGQAVRFAMFRRILPNLSISLARADRKTVRSLAGPAGWYALGDSIEGFRDNASVIVLGLVQNVATSGVFAVGEKLATFGTKLGSPLTEPYFPHAASLVGRGDGSELRQAAHTGSRLTAGVTIPCCVVVAVLARPALISWVGSTYQRATPAVVILAVAFGLRSFGAASSKIVSGSGGQRLIAVTSVVEVATQITLTAVLGIFFGLTGVAVAILSSVVCVELAATLPLLSRRLGVHVMRLVSPVLRAHVPPVAITGTAGWLVSSRLVMPFVTTHGRFADLAVVAATGVAVLIVYAAVFSVTGLNRAERHDVVGRVRRMAPATTRAAAGEDRDSTARSTPSQQSSDADGESH